MAKKTVKNTQAIENTVEVIKEDVTMAENTINTTAEAIEEVAVPTGPKQMLLVTASRGKNTKLAWNVIEVSDDDMTQKVKGCAIELPAKAAEIIGNDKFISYIDLDIIAKCVEEQKAVRGTASTVSDVYTRYCKVTDTKGERVAVALEVFGTILTAVENGENNGAWVRPEPEKEEKTEAPKENVGGIKKAETEEPEEEINPDDVVE